MSIQAVKEYLRAFGLEGKIQQLNVSSATVELAAAALGVAAWVDVCKVRELLPQDPTN